MSVGWEAPPFTYIMSELTGTAARLQLAAVLQAVGVPLVPPIQRLIALVASVYTKPPLRVPISPKLLVMVISTTPVDRAAGVVAVIDDVVLTVKPAALAPNFTEVIFV